MRQHLVTLMVEVSVIIFGIGILENIFFNFILSKYYFSYLITCCNYVKFLNRLYVLSWFPHLIHLDDRTVTEQQLLQAKKLFRRSLLEDFVVVPECLKDLHNKIAIYSKSSTSDEQRVFSGTNLIV